MNGVIEKPGIALAAYFAGEQNTVALFTVTPPVFYRSSTTYAEFGSMGDCCVSYFGKERFSLNHV